MHVYPFDFDINLGSDHYLVVPPHPGMTDSFFFFFKVTDFFRPETPQGRVGTQSSRVVPWRQRRRWVFCSFSLTWIFFTIDFFLATYSSVCNYGDMGMGLESSRGGGGEIRFLVSCPESDWPKKWNVIPLLPSPMICLGSPHGSTSVPR